MVEEGSEGAAALQPMGSLVEGNGDATAPHPPSTSGSQPIWLNSLECKGGGHPDIGIVFQAPPPPLPSESCSQQQIRAVVELVEEDFRSNTVTMELGKLVEGKGVMESVLVEKDIRSKELSMDLSNSGLEASLLSPLNVGQGCSFQELLYGATSGSLCFTGLQQPDALAHAYSKPAGSEDIEEEQDDCSSDSVSTKLDNNVEDGYLQSGEEEIETETEEHFRGLDGLINIDETTNLDNLDNLDWEKFYSTGELVKLVPASSAVDTTDGAVAEQPLQPAVLGDCGCVTGNIEPNINLPEKQAFYMHTFTLPILEI